MKHLLFLFAILALVYACSKKVYSNTDELHGLWTMTSFVAFMPALPEFEEEDIQWHFNATKNTLVVKHKYPAKTDFGLRPGNYRYTRSGKTLTIEGSDYHFSFQDGVLVLDSNTDPRLSNDGPIMRFKRMK